jgi:osmotically inducible protein OsmC
VSTPQLRDRIFELLRDGVPLRVMCRAGVAARGGRAAAGKAGGASRSAPVRGRENGLSRSYDGRLDVKLAVAGSARIGANPEQLFATAWSACFVSAIALAARKRKIVLPADPAIDAEADLLLANGGSFLRARSRARRPR